MAAVLASANAQEESGLVPTALEFMARATSTSEVLTLNLTNLLILIVLKALIFGFGIFLQGPSSTARSDDASLVTESELTGGMCFLMFSAGDDTKLSCVQKAACNDIDTFRGYTDAGKMMYKLHKMLGMDFSDKYTDVLNAVTEATEHGAQGGNCAKYQW